MNAADAMTRTLVTIGPDAPILQAIRLMLQHRISGLPVVDAAGGLVGIITEGDLLRRGETGTERRRPRWLEFLLGPGRRAGDYVEAHARRVGEVMTREVATVEETTPLDEVVRAMEERRVKRLPVLREGRLVGILSRANLLRALAVAAAETGPALAGDEAIRERLAAEIGKQSWAPPTLPNIMVRNGVVHVWGLVTSDEQRVALKVLAENVPGVKAVRDHLVWIEPFSGLVVEPLDQEEGAPEPGKGPQQPRA
jgi:CBS domain-containing protein